LSFDLDRSLRLFKPQKRTERLQRRPDMQLRWADYELPIGMPLLLDTSVYLDVLQGHSPAVLDQLLNYRRCHHSAVCLAELSHVFGRLDPGHANTKSVLRAIRETIDDIPAHRLHAPDNATWGEAGILAGEIARLSDAPPALGGARKFLKDALIYLQAGTLGAAVLTGNVRDFDWLNQLVPDIAVVLYRKSA
jgi:hypothetical protein